MSYVNHCLCGMFFYIGKSNLILASLQSFYRWDDKKIITVVPRILPAFCSWASLHISCHTRSNQPSFSTGHRAETVWQHCSQWKRLGFQVFLFDLAVEIKFKKNGKKILFHLHSISFDFDKTEIVSFWRVQSITFWLPFSMHYLLGGTCTYTFAEGLDSTCSVFPNEKQVY